MLQTNSIVVLAPGIGTRVLQFMNSVLPPQVIVENKSSDFSAMIEYEESDDMATWATLVGTSKSIQPLGADGQIVLSNKRYLALFAQGNVNLHVTVLRQYGDMQDLR